ncbi:MAG: transglycosylase domain-containing protein [Flavipsychrobacter sp.]|nr:transglycosylase domain-containing protein [Flavipsychrobacter sp.]
MKRSVRILWRVFWGSVIVFNLLILMINWGWLGYMPSMKELENPSSALASDIYASKGEKDDVLIGRYYIQDRSTSKFEDISPNILNALIATEDVRFYEHSGIDPKATLAIPIYMVMQKKRGSSTITQQLAKNLFPRKNENKLTIAFLKLKEWVMAVKLERNLTKNEIITLYLNTVPFSDNVYGIRNASLTFFNKLPAKVSVEEAAVLVGMLKGNTLYNPRRNPGRAFDRRNLILGEMVENNVLKKEEADELKTKPIKLDYHKLDYHEGLAPYFRQVVEQEVKQAIKELKKYDGTPYNIYTDGLKIYTTLDVDMQHHAEEALQEHLAALQKEFIAQPSYASGAVWNKYNNILMQAVKNSPRYLVAKEDGMKEKEILAEFNKPVKMRVFAWNKERYKDTVMSPMDSIKYTRLFLQAGFIAMDPFSGYVKAWVGGIDHNYFQYDHVNQKARRQVGSTIKPLLYTLAVDNGISPCDQVQTTPQDFPGLMKGSYDAGGSKKGPSISMGSALANSINNAALYLLKQVGVNAFVDFVHKCGISATVEPYPSAALGVSDISLYEMLWAYTMFPNQGINTKPIFITRIEDKNGVLIKNFSPESKEIINPVTAYRMVKMMQGVVDHGTGARMRHRYGIKGDIAGKTGTTNKQADAWFIGYTPQILCGAWVGCDDRVFRFGSERLGQGAAAALPIWAYFMRRVYADPKLGYTTEKKFEVPENYNDCNVLDPTSFDRGSTYGSYGDDAYDGEQEQIPAIPEEEWR